jgi:hypothetical protein|tara:strand:- start:280 stop:984 length:705 start_codon:yes stop_codon:yes gene_type:complete
MNTIFISGESINLCAPVEEDFEQWASWFNSQEKTKFLAQGKYPNTVELQKDFYKNAISSGRFLTMIKTKSMRLLGVISLSEIEYEKSSCQISLVCPEKSKKSILAPLEAMALVTEHAFQRLGLSRVWAGQPYPGLLDWSKRLEIIGYKAEGITRNSFVHGCIESDSVFISIIKQDYLNIIARRNNVLWPGEKHARSMISNMKNSLSLSEELYNFLRQNYENFDKRLYTLEKESE